MSDSMRSILTRGQIAELFSVSPKTVTRWVLSNQLPRPIQIGGSQRWRLETILEHLRMKELAAAGGISDESVTCEFDAAGR